MEESLVSHRNEMSLLLACLGLAWVWLIGYSLSATFILLSSNLDSRQVPESTTADARPLIQKIKAAPLQSGFRICVEGDTNLATLEDIVTRGEDVYQYAQSALSDCDYTVANLETNISTPGIGSAQLKGFTYNAPLAAISQLQYGGVDIVTLANNHSMDFGPAAILDEMTHLREGGIKYFGAGSNISEAFAPTYTQYRGTKLAFIAANDIENWITDATDTTAGSAYFNETLLSSSIAKAKQNADIVMIYLHWGDENSELVNERQIYFARKFIEAGVDIVVGTGPHIRQMHDTYQGKPIYYSIGNFAVRGFFGWPDRSKGDILKIDIQDKHIVATSTTEVTIDFVGLPNGPYK